MKLKCVVISLFFLAGLALAQEKEFILFSPPENLMSHKNKVLIKGIAANAASLSINNEPVSLDKSGRFYIKKTLLKPNEYTLFELKVIQKDGVQKTFRQSGRMVELKNVP